jgi:hypothetical protein
MEDIVDAMLTPKPGALERDFDGNIPHQNISIITRADCSHAGE